MQTWDRHQLDFWTAALPDELWRLPAALAQVLRLFYWPHRYQLPDRVLVQEVADSFHGRRLCHRGGTGRVPHPTTLTNGGTAGPTALRERR